MPKGTNSYYLYIIYQQKNIMKKIFALIALVACMALSSCNSKQAAINDLRSLRDDIAINGGNYDVNDWLKAKDRFEKVNEKLNKYRDEFSYEESRQIGQLKGECIAEFGKNVLLNIGNKALNAKGEIEGIVEGVKNAIGNH